MDVHSKCNVYIFYYLYIVGSIYKDKRKRLRISDDDDDYYNIKLITLKLENTIIL